ncbi:MAG: hypothetical protein AVDCRST_MAG87-2347, partial [uncultured Thermomicrobiales bacterium]
RRCRSAHADHHPCRAGHRAAHSSRRTFRGCNDRRV